MLGISAHERFRYGLWVAFFSVSPPTPSTERRVPVANGISEELAPSTGRVPSGRVCGRLRDLQRNGSQMRSFLVGRKEANRRILRQAPFLRNLLWGVGNDRQWEPRIRGADFRSRSRLGLNAKPNNYSYS